MGAKEDYLEAISVNSKTVYYIIPKSGFLKKESKIKFVIKPLLPNDIFTEDLKQLVIKEMSTGQSLEDASRIAAENFKKKFFQNSDNGICKLLLEKGVLYPKIVEKEKDLQEDELPFSLLTWDIKIFLLHELQKISPIFQGN